MKTILEKVAYLKGLSDGLKIDSTTNEGKLLNEIIEILEELALSIDDLDYRQELIVEDLEDIDMDLSDLESYVFDFEDYDFDDLDDFDFDDLEDKYLDIFDELDYLDDPDFEIEENEEINEIEF